MRRAQIRGTCGGTPLDRAKRWSLLAVAVGAALVCGVAAFFIHTVERLPDFCAPDCGLVRIFLIHVAGLTGSGSLACAAASAFSPYFARPREEPALTLAAAA